MLLPAVWAAYKFTSFLFANFITEFQSKGNFTSCRGEAYSTFIPGENDDDPGGWQTADGRIALTMEQCTRCNGGTTFSEFTYYQGEPKTAIAALAFLLPVLIVTHMAVRRALALRQRAFRLLSFGIMADSAPFDKRAMVLLATAATCLITICCLTVASFAKETEADKYLSGCNVDGVVVSVVLLQAVPTRPVSECAPSRLGALPKTAGD